MSQPTLESLGYSSKEELLDALVAEALQLGGHQEHFELNSPLMLDVCGAIQIALRRPDVPARNRSALRGFLNQLIIALQAEGLRAHAAVLFLGSDPANDVTIQSTKGGE